MARTVKVPVTRAAVYTATSRQRKQLQGKCWVCPEQAQPGRIRCRACALKHAAKERARKLRVRGGLTGRRSVLGSGP